MSVRAAIQLATETHELADFATYVSTLPPLKLWVDVRQELNPRSAVNTTIFWEWLGKSLNAFFGDESDPVPDSGLSEDFQGLIQHQSSQYIALSALVFQAEKFLRQEAQELGFKYPFERRSDLLKRLALERCLYQIALAQQNDWESLSTAQMVERHRDTLKLLKGETSKERMALAQARWHKEDAKLSRSGVEAFNRLTPWNTFCQYVFIKNRRQLPAFEPYLATLGLPKNFSRTFKKFAVLNGQFRDYPGRGKGKKTNATS